MDPVIFIDPVWLSTHPGYSVIVSSGIGNPDPSASPVANAGMDQNVNELASVSLYGTGSHDSNTPLLPITYAWTQLSGMPVTLANSTTASPTFTAPPVPAAGAALVFQLAVNNGVTTPATDSVTVNIVTVNGPPTANAGTDQTVGENSVVTLSASGSDPDGDTLTMHWSQVAGYGPTVVLLSADTASPIFAAPEVTAAQGTVDLKFQLVVNDGNLNSGPSTVIVHVRNVNHAPLADAGPDQAVPESTPVTLNGATSADKDGDALTFAWLQTAGRSVTLDNASTDGPNFTTPDTGPTGATRLSW